MLPLFSELLESSQRSALLALQQFLIDELSDDFDAKLQTNGVLVTCKVTNPSGRVGVNIPQDTLFSPWPTGAQPGMGYDTTFEKVGVISGGRTSPRMYFSHNVIDRMNKDAAGATYIMDRYSK